MTTTGRSIRRPVQHPTDRQPHGDDVFLRVRKTGREYAYLFSGDGEKWTQLGSRVKAGWERPRVGVFAVSPDSGRNIPARFDFFTVEPIDPGEEPRLSLPADTAPAEPGPGQIAVAYQNPVFLGDSPDPGIVRSGDGFYVVSTQAYLFNEDVGLPLFRSRDLVNWEFLGGIFTRENLPQWVNADNPTLWAPDLVRGGAKVG